MTKGKKKRGSTAKEPAEVPTFLSAEAKGIWEKIIAEYELGTAELLILRTGLESFDRLQEARKVIAKDGSVYKTKSGYRRPHPALTTEKESRSGLLNAFRLLGLDYVGENDRRRPGHPTED